VTCDMFLIQRLGQDFNHVLSSADFGSDDVVELDIGSVHFKRLDDSDDKRLTDEHLR